jgi:hypothetical protein
MAENKTKETKASVASFLGAIEDTRKQNLAVYIMPGFHEFPTLMKKLGKHKTGKSCLYLNKLEDVDEKVLQKLINDSVKIMRKRYNVK